MLRRDRPPTRTAHLVAAVLAANLAAAPAADLQTPQQLAARVESVPDEHPLAPALKMADEALQKAAAVSDYEADFVKKEVVAGRLSEQKMKIRFRRRPLSVYLRFVDPAEGRQVLYVEGQNGGQMQVKDVGLASLVGTISVDPHGTLAMSESKYPITMIGFENMTRRLMSAWLDDIKRSDITVQFYPNARIGTQGCKVIETTYADAGRSQGIHRVRLYIEKTSGLPIRIQEYGFPVRPGAEPPLLSDYAYLNVRPNVGLTSADFDTANPRYGF
jgi:Protein of unknown function (DUF1571)